MPVQHSTDPNGKPSIYVPMNASGGGEGGYVFTDLAHLDSVIAKWDSFIKDIEKDGRVIWEAAQQIVPPAKDGPSGRQALAARDFLTAGVDHNEAMRVYAKGYLDRLTATRAQYAADDEGSADRLRNTDPD